MDGVGLAASIIAIATAGLQISVKLIAFASQVKTASQQVNFLANDVSITSSILHQLGELIEQKADQNEVGIFNSHGLTTTKASADVCKRIFEVIEEELKNASKQTRTGVRVGDRIELSRTEQAKWPFLQPSMDSLRKDLQEAKGTLMLTLQVATLGVHITLSRNCRVANDNDSVQNDLVSTIKALQSQLRDLKLASGANAHGMSQEGPGPAFPATQESIDSLPDVVVESALRLKHNPPNRDRGIDLEAPTKKEMCNDELLRIAPLQIPSLGGAEVFHTGSDHTSKHGSPRIHLGNDSDQQTPYLPMTKKVWPSAQTSSHESKRSFRTVLLFLAGKGRKWLSVPLQSRTTDCCLHLFMQVLDRELNKSPVRPLFREVRICQEEIRNQLRLDQRRNRASLAQTLTLCTQDEHNAIDWTLTSLGSRALLLSIGRTVPDIPADSKDAQVFSVMHLVTRTPAVKEGGRPPVVKRTARSSQTIATKHRFPGLVSLSDKLTKSRRSADSVESKSRVQGRPGYRPISHPHPFQPMMSTSSAAVRDPERGTTDIYDHHPVKAYGYSRPVQSSSAVAMSYGSLHAAMLDDSWATVREGRNYLETVQNNSISNTISPSYRYARSKRRAIIAELPKEKMHKPAEAKQQLSLDHVRLATADIDTLLAKYTTVFDPTP